MVEKFDLGRRASVDRSNTDPGITQLKVNDSMADRFFKISLTNEQVQVKYLEQGVCEVTIKGTESVRSQILSSLLPSERSLMPPPPQRFSRKNVF